MKYVPASKLDELTKPQLHVLNRTVLQGNLHKITMSIDGMLKFFYSLWTLNIWLAIILKVLSLSCYCNSFCLATCCHSNCPLLLPSFCLFSLLLPSAFLPCSSLHSAQILVSHKILSLSSFSVLVHIKLDASLVYFSYTCWGWQLQLSADKITFWRFKAKLIYLGSYWTSRWHCPGLLNFAVDNSNKIFNCVFIEEAVNIKHPALIYLPYYSWKTLSFIISACPTINISLTVMLEVVTLELTVANPGFWWRVGDDFPLT
jgi:hypothetical protein